MKRIFFLVAMTAGNLFGCKECVRLINTQNMLTDAIVDKVWEKYPNTDPDFLEGYKIGIHRGYGVSLYCMSLYHPELFPTLEGDIQ